jgi:hypothetical protein
MAKIEREIHMLQYPDWTAKDNYARNRRRRQNRSKEKELKIKTKFKTETVGCVVVDDEEEDLEGSNKSCFEIDCPSFASTQ